MSLIIDGMDQAHSRIPHLGNNKEFSEPLSQHIQGVLVHGIGKLFSTHIHCSFLFFVAS